MSSSTYSFALSLMPTHANDIFVFTQKIPRGIPDGKSGELVANEATDDVAKYNLHDSKKVASTQPYTQRGRAPLKYYFL